MLVIGLIVLLGAVYFYTGRLAEGVDKRADDTDALLRDMAEKAAKAAADLIAATERQAKAFEEVRAALAEHRHYVFEVGRELSAAGRDLRFAMQLVEKNLDSKAAKAVREWLAANPDQLDNFSAHLEALLVAEMAVKD